MLLDPAAIAVNVTLVGMVTTTGVVLSVVLLLPSAPYEPYPQQYTVPVVVRAQVCVLPAAIAVKVTPAGMVTATGMLRWVVVPLPSSPYIPYPQQYTVPVVVRAQLCLLPPAPIDAKVIPVGIVTATGILLPVVVPLPSAP